MAGHEQETTVEARLLDLVSKVGELAKEALKVTQYGRKPFETADEWSGELADALFSLICVANSTGVNLQSALNDALIKYESRLARRGDAGSGR